MPGLKRLDGASGPLGESDQRGRFKSWLSGAYWEYCGPGILHACMGRMVE